MVFIQALYKKIHTLFCFSRLWLSNAYFMYKCGESDMKSGNYA